jgi:hypothetical protein
MKQRERTSRVYAGTPDARWNAIVSTERPRSLKTIFRGAPHHRNCRKSDIIVLVDDRNPII